MFIYALKESAKNVLLYAGFNLVTTQNKGDNLVWVFEYDDKIPMPNFTDKDDMFLSKKMSF